MGDYSNNKYYKHFLLTIGSGFDPSIEPNLGAIYRYRGGIHKKRPQFVFGSFHRRRGLGFGSFFQSLFQRAAPLLRTLGNKTIDIVSNIAKDTIQGENIKDSAIKHIQQAVPAAFTGFAPSANTDQKKSVSFSTPRKKLKSKKLKRTGAGINQLYPALKLIKHGASSI